MDDHVIEAAQHSHPFVAQHGERRSATAAASLPPIVSPLEDPLPSPQAPVQELEFTVEDLGGLRQFLVEWSSGERLGPEAVGELVLAVNELATNSVRYGGGSGSLLAWREQDTLLCEIRDAGHIQDPLLGRSRPSSEQSTGRGLWLVHELCDLVQLRSSQGSTVVRIHKRLPGKAA